MLRESAISLKEKGPLCGLKGEHANVASLTQEAPLMRLSVASLRRMVKRKLHVVKYLLKIDRLCFDGQQTSRLATPRGAHDRAERREGSVAVSDAGAVSPARSAVRAGARAKRRGPPLRAQCSDDSAVAEAVA